MHHTWPVYHSVWFSLGHFWMVFQVELLGNDVIKWPCSFRVWNNSFMGLWALVYRHIRLGLKCPNMSITLSPSTSKDDTDYIDLWLHRKHCKLHNIHLGNLYLGKYAYCLTTKNLPISQCYHIIRQPKGKNLTSEAKSQPVEIYEVSLSLGSLNLS